jgi:CubicO group peptidase (beta-lactamase class C family)
MSRFLTLGTFLVLVLTVSAQKRVVGGPSPEIRDHLDSLIKAYNSGSADEWEKMAQKHFSPEGLKARTRAQRKQMFERMHGDFGATISISRVERQGPDAPLKASVKGATGLEAVFQIELESDAPYRIRSLSVQVGGPPDDDASEASPPPVNGKMSNDELSRAIDGYFQNLLTADKFSGVVLVARDGEPVFHKPYGFADRANKIPNTAATRFNLGSINKKFTQTAIQQLVARGKLSLNDTVGKLLPDYPQELTRAATIDQLLNHQAGIANFFGPEFDAAPKDRFRSNADYYKFVSSQKPLFAPGARNQYCNGCYIVLGAIIERVSGMTYEKYVEENIFKPAGMAATGAIQADAILPNVALGYTRQTADGQLRSNIYMHGASGSAAGGGFSTAADLLAFTQALKSGRIPDAKPPEGGMGIAGGAPGINAIVEQEGPWTVIVLTNMDPRAAEEPGAALARALSK